MLFVFCEAPYALYENIGVDRKTTSRYQRYPEHPDRGTHFACHNFRKEPHDEVGLALVGPRTSHPREICRRRQPTMAPFCRDTGTVEDFPPDHLHLYELA